MAEVNFSDIMRNPHFSQFVAVLSVPYNSMYWRKQHPAVPFWLLSEELQKAVFCKDLWSQYRQRAFNAFVSMLVALVEADIRLHYSIEDMDWLSETLYGPHGQVALSMLLACASSKQAYLTPVQTAKITNEAESTWRNRCADGEVIGARKAGKQWLIPTTTLQAYGYKVEMRGQTAEDEDE